MATAGIIAFVALLIVVPIFLVNRDIVGRKARHRRHRSTSTPPFLFFPTSDEHDEPPPVPAWNGHTAGLASSQHQPVKPEPGLADMPPTSGLQSGNEPARDARNRRKGSDRRTVP